MRRGDVAIDLAERRKVGKESTIRGRLATRAACSSLARRPREPRGEQPALRERRNFGCRGEQPHEVVEPIGGAVLEIEQEDPTASHDAAAAGQLAERLLADLVPEIPHELQAFLEESQRIDRHESDPSPANHRPAGDQPHRGPYPPEGRPSCSFRFSIAERYSA